MFLTNLSDLLILEHFTRLSRLLAVLFFRGLVWLLLLYLESSPAGSMLLVDLCLALCPDAAFVSLGGLQIASIPLSNNEFLLVLFTRKLARVCQFHKLVVDLVDVSVSLKLIGGSHERYFSHHDDLL